MRVFVYIVEYSEEVNCITGLCVKSDNGTQANFAVMTAIVNHNTTPFKTGYKLHNPRLVRIHDVKES